MKRLVLTLGLVFSLCALDHAAAATITMNDVEEFSGRGKTYYTFNLNIDWDKADQKWTDLSTSWKTEGGKTFSTKGGLAVNKKGEPTSFDNEFMEYGGKNSSKATWAYRMEISLYQTESGEWDWYGTIQRWEKEAGQNKNMFKLAGEIKKPMSTPIPSAAWLLGAGLIGLLGVRYRFRRS